MYIYIHHTYAPIPPICPCQKRAGFFYKVIPFSARQFTRLIFQLFNQKQFSDSKPQKLGNSDEYSMGKYSFYFCQSSCFSYRQE